MGKLRILLVDDEVDFLELIGARIRGWGHDLKVATNGREAVETVKKDRPDIVILDYMMPDMDGLSTLKVIRKIASNLPVIMFTAYPDIKSMKGAEKLGVSAFIPKLSAYSDAQTSLKVAIGLIEQKLAKKE